MNKLEISELPQIKLENTAIDYQTVVLEAIDQTFAKLGKTIRSKLYLILEEHYKLNNNNLPDKTHDFVIALEQIFGPSVLLVEMEVMKNIRQKVPQFEYKVEKRNLDFEEYLRSFKSYSKVLEC